MQLQKHRLQVTTDFVSSACPVNSRFVWKVKNIYCFLRSLVLILKTKQQMYRISRIFQIVIIALSLNHNLKSQVFIVFSAHPVSTFLHACHLMVAI